MTTIDLTHVYWLALAIVLEIVANVFLKYSDGFKRVTYGIFSLIAVLAAFVALSKAVKGIDLSVAYALWGGIGLIATAALGWVLFKQIINCKGWLGVLLIISGMILIKLS
ncbi:multidrug/spermidine efflux SMR transporter subunit MdtI [Enterobacter hormaechei]